MIVDLDNSCLRAFLAVIDEGGFTRAAEKLNRTQSAVSMQIKRLEDALGVRLIADRKRATLTPAGERIISHARRIVALNDETVGRASGADIAGRVRIGTPDDYAAFLLPLVLRRLAITHPQIEVEVRCDLSIELIKAVDHGQLDLALVTRLPGLEGGVTVRREALHWVARSEDVAEHRPLPLALFSRGCPFREATEEALQGAGLGWRLAYESRNLASLLPAVSEGLAVAVIAETSIPKGLKILGPEHGLPPLPAVEIAVYGSRGLVSRAAQAVQASAIAALSEAVTGRAAA
jgi:DNA-binding transcriptional LysR family regulator